MGTANSMAELEAMIRQEMMKAMQVVQSKAEADMYEETGSFFRTQQGRILDKIQQESV